MEPLGNLPSHSGESTNLGSVVVSWRVRGDLKKKVRDSGPFFEIEAVIKHPDVSSLTSWIQNAHYNHQNPGKNQKIDLVRFLSGLCLVSGRSTNRRAFDLFLHPNLDHPPSISFLQ